MQTSYEELPYESVPFAQTHPDRLATLSWLFGITPPLLDQCRVLELGCASGGNLIPMAVSLPGAQFTGIDLSAHAIERGMADVARLRLSNVRLLHMDINDFGESFGSFDYVVAHGVYSWVPGHVQEKLLQICARHLAPNGVAYVSYNTLPGWWLRGAVRDAMLYHTRQFSDARTRVQQARAMLDFLVESLQGSTSPYGAALREEAQYVRQQPDFYVFHDHLEEVNDPVYFHQFIAHALRHGLRYLADTDLRSMLVGDLAPRVQETLARIAPDLLQREQMLDFLRSRSFRQTLLVHQDTTLKRLLSPERIFALHIATLAQPARTTPDLASDAVEEFVSADGARVTTRRLLTKAAMATLAQASPSAIAFDRLCTLAKERLEASGVLAPDDQGALASDLLQGFVAGVVELHIAASPFATEPGDHPQASVMVRLQAERGARVTNLRHESVDLDQDDRRLAVLLDGTRTRDALAGTDSPGESTTNLAKLNAALSRFARKALLVQ